MGAELNSISNELQLRERLCVLFIAYIIAGNLSDYKFEVLEHVNLKSFFKDLNFLSARPFWNAAYFAEKTCLVPNNSAKFFNTEVYIEARCH